MSKPNSTYILDKMQKREFIIKSVQNMCNDYDVSKFNINTEAFEQILKAAERFPTRSAYENVDFDMHDFNKGVQNGDPIMFWEQIHDFRAIKTYEIAYFSEDVTVKNFPNAKNSAIYFKPDNSILITKNAKNQAGAWEFAKFMLDNPDMEKSFSYLFELKKSILEEEAEKSKYNPMNGDNKYTLVGYNGNIEIDNNTDEDIEKVMNIITNVDTMWHYDEKISRIIEEEVDAFLSGQHSPKEFTDIIQNRINLYINEMK